ncbi:hypothetical protein, partial [Salmonella sp. s51228]|uniref:hypothetical protein n=1 Tax=Salmonella sp. s51228 TaxID=3159652 RepID=UPI00397EC1E6
MTSASHVQSTRIGQVITAGMERAITTVDKAVEYVLPPSEEHTTESDNDCCDDDDDDDKKNEVIEIGVWEQSKGVTIKAGNRITAIAKYRAGTVSEYVGEK